MTNKQHRLVGGTLVADANGVRAVCVCGWNSGARFSGAVASAIFRDHVERPDEPPPQPASVTIAEQMKAFAVEQLARRKATKPEPIQNHSLIAGSKMFFYCRSCGWPTDILPELFISKPRALCGECQLLKDKGWADV